MSVNAIPDGYASVTPYLIVRGAKKAIEFYKKVFDADVRLCLPNPDGRVMHAELEIGDSVIMLADECPERDAKSPEAFGGSPVSIHLYVEEVDEVFAEALAAGAKETRPVENQFYGDRAGGFTDPFGHQWHVATHVEDVSEDEMQRRMADMNSKA
jgi:PhnB protein